MNRDVLLTGFTRLLIVVFGLATSILTARWLGPVGRGEFGVLVTLATMIVQFGNLGLASTMTYQLAGDRSLFAALLRNAIWVAVVGGGLLSALVALTIIQVDLYPGIESQWILLAVGVSPALLFNMLGGNLLVGLGQILTYNLFQIGSTLMLFCSIVLARYLDVGVVGCLWATLLAWTASALVLAVNLWRQGGRGWRFDARLLRAGMGFSSRVYIACLLAHILLRSNLLMLERFCDAGQVGFYAIALQGIDTLLILPGSVALTLFPRLVKAPEARWQLTRQALIRMVLGMSAVCLFAAITIAPAIRLLFGEAYVPSAAVFVAMLPAAMFLGMTTVLSQYLAAWGIPRSVIGIWLTGILAMCVANQVLVPAYQAVGAAWSFSIASGLVLILMGGVATRIRVAEVPAIAQSSPAHSLAA